MELGKEQPSVYWSALQYSRSQYLIGKSGCPELDRKLVDADCEAMDDSKACDGRASQSGKPAGSVSAEITETLEHGEIHVVKTLPGWSRRAVSYRHAGYSHR